MTSPGPHADLKLQRSSRDPATVPALLEAWLAGELPDGADPKVTLHSGIDANGMSSETLVFDATWTEDGEQRTGEYVARVAPAAEDIPVFMDYALQDQYDAMRIVGERTDVPVPTVGLFEPTGEVLGTPFFLMDRIDGVVPPDVPPYNWGDNWLADAVPGGPAPAPGQHRQGDRRPARHPGRRPTLRLPRPRRRTRARPARAQPGVGARLVRVGGPRHRPVADGRARAGLARGQRARHAPPTRCCAGATPDRQRACSRTSRRSASSTGRWPRSARARWTCRGWSSRTGVRVDHRGVRDARACRTSCARRTSGRRTPTLTGVELGDLTWYHLYNGVQWCVVFMRTGARSIHFGEVERPDDVESLFHHKPLMERLLAKVGA